MIVRRAACALIFVLAATGSARADPTPADKETARELFNQGKEAHATGDVERALEKLTAAHKLAATPITALELARVHAELHHLVVARDIALSVARMPEGKTESDRAKEARRAAAQLAESIHARIPTLTIVVNVTPPGREATIALDGKELPTLSGEIPYRLDPGAHEVTARIGDGPMASVHVDLAEGETRSVSLDVTAASAAEPPRPAPQTRSPVLLWTGIASAAAGTLIGTATGIAALEKASTHACRDTSCTPEGRSDISAGRTFATVSTIAFGVAIVGAGVAVYALVSRNGKTASRTAEWLGIAWPHSPVQ